MEFTSRTINRTVLMSLIILVIPMVTFPSLLGTELAKASLTAFLIELVVYAVLVFFIRSQANLIQLAQTAGICLIYRLILGTIFGLLISVMYAMRVTVSVPLGLISYLPAVILQVLATPFILLPIIDQIIPSNRRRLVVQPPTSDIDISMTIGTGSSKNSVVRSNRPAGAGAGTRNEIPMGLKRTSIHTASPLVRELTGFDRATRYLGEDGSVQLAAVVDREGLLVSNFCRGDIIAEDWAPLAILFGDATAAVLDRAKLGSADKVDLLVNDRHVVVVDVDGFKMMVVAERRGDDLLGVRINQGIEIIRKFIKERYSKLRESNLEKSYVSGAKRS